VVFPRDHKNLPLDQGSGGPKREEFGFAGVDTEYFHPYVWAKGYNRFSDKYFYESDPDNL